MTDGYKLTAIVRLENPSGEEMMSNTLVYSRLAYPQVVLLEEQLTRALAGLNELGWAMAAERDPQGTAAARKFRPTP
jgi:hypothetical protein